MMVEQHKEAIQHGLHGIPGICFAILYGSAADSESFRDVDVGIWIDRTVLPPAQDLDFAFDLAAKLEKLIPFPVDVRVINDAPLAFRYNVSKGIPLIVHDEEQFARFLERTWDEYLDFEPVAMQYIREMA
jgi:predicted nucleotidyltransferase